MIYSKQDYKYDTRVDRAIRHISFWLLVLALILIFTMNINSNSRIRKAEQYIGITEKKNKPLIDSFFLQQIQN
jgi:hypothetical protein